MYTVSRLDFWTLKVLRRNGAKSLADSMVCRVTMFFCICQSVSILPSCEDAYKRTSERKNDAPTAVVYLFLFREGVFPGSAKPPLGT